MTDTFSKACLAVMAISLAVIAYAQACGRDQQASAITPAPAVTQATTAETTADTGDKRCKLALSEAQVTLSALEAQIRNVPAMVQTKDAEGNVTDESPNRLYEQLMLQIIQTKTELETLTAKCGA